MASAHRKRKKQSGTTAGNAAPTLVPKAAQHTTLLVCAFLFAVTLLIYSGTLRNGFINYDDREYITENPYIQHGLNFESTRWAFTSFRAGNWHPLTWISHEIDMQFFGLAPAGHHFVSAIFHTLNALLLFLLLWKTTGYRGRSFLVAALFAVHPLNVEVVAWAAERKTLLSTLLFFLAVGAYGWYAKKPSLSRYTVLALFFALALLAKPMVITLPFVLLLLDYWPLQRIESWTQPRESWAASRKSWLGLVLEKLPLLLLSAGSAAMTLTAQSKAVVPLSVIPIPWRIENAIVSYALYLVKAVFPIRLAPFYPNYSAPNLLAVSLASGLLAGISVWVWRERATRRYLVVGWLWYLGTLIPVIGLVQVGAQAMADRYAYTPLIGIFVMIVWRVSEAADARSFFLNGRIAVASVVLLILASLTRRQVGFWRDSITLWTHTLAVTQNNMVAEDNLGTALMDAGRDEDAITRFRNAIRIKPTEPKAHMALGALLQKQGDTSQAVEEFKTALPLTRDPEDLLAIYTDLAVAYQRSGDYAAASEGFQKILQLDPANTGAMSSLGKVLLMQSATRLAQEMGAHPTAEGFTQLGSMWEQAEEVDRAKQAYDYALKLNPKLASAQIGLQRVTGHSQ